MNVTIHLINGIPETVTISNVIRFMMNSNKTLQIETREYVGDDIFSNTFLFDMNEIDSFFVS